MSDLSTSLHFVRELCEENLFLHIQRKESLYITVHCAVCPTDYVPLHPKSSIMLFSLKIQYVVKCQFLFVVGQFLSPFY